MKIIHHDKTSYFLRFDRGESFVEVFKDFLNEHHIEGGWFTGLGAFQDPEVAYYDMAKKEYLPIRRSGIFEIVAFTGNIAMYQGSPVVHAHVVLGDIEGVTHGGHFRKGIVGGTVEVRFVVYPKSERKFDPETGLSLLA